MNPEFEERLIRAALRALAANRRDRCVDSMSDISEPTPQQIENAKAAGWNPDDGPPPGGWDAHGTPPPIDPELGTNGIAPTDAERVE